MQLAAEGGRQAVGARVRALVEEHGGAMASTSHLRARIVELTEQAAARDAVRVRLGL